MKSFVWQCVSSLGTGAIVGILFAFLRLPVPAPPVVPAVFGIMGITLGYLLYQRWFG